uniref:Lymphocyte antigen 96 n=1 Tax=Geotrypetes seraphini TaxID=260995 RepID=A0A6P8Q6V6_GEOSA|nr:lymphocyte antigen 96 [Geotrypetes seraphini]
MELWYSICDNVNKHSLSVSIDPCIFSRGAKYNFSASWIPRYDLINMRATVDIWFESLKVSGNVYFFCTGTDDAYEFCGTLKGETINITKEHRFTKIKYQPGTYTVSLQAMTVEQQEETVLLCINATLILKN